MLFFIPEFIRQPCYEPQANMRLTQYFAFDHLSECLRTKRRSLSTATAYA